MFLIYTLLTVSNTKTIFYFSIRKDYLMLVDMKLL